MTPQHRKPFAGEPLSWLQGLFLCVFFSGALWAMIWVGIWLVSSRLSLLQWPATLIPQN